MNKRYDSEDLQVFFCFGFVVGIAIVFLITALFTFVPAINDERTHTLADEVCQLKFGTNAERWENQVLTCKQEIEPRVNPYVIDLGGENELHR